jgi:hypothetical protein
VSRGAAALLAVAALAACAQLQPPAPVQQLPAPPPVPSPPPVAAPAIDEESRQVSELLGYYHRVAQLGPDEQKRELAAATQALNRERSSASRVRLALVYVVPGTAFQDDSRAMQLLEPVVNGAGGALRSLASLVHAQAAERVKTQKRADQLKEQVDALRAIEKQLIDRGQQSQPRK